MPDHKAPELIVRAHRRRNCSMAGWASIASGDAARVVLSGAATAHDGSVECRVVDFSEGGVGLRCGVFIPVGCGLVVRVVARERAPALQVRGVVRRVQMVGRGPEYYLGLAFLDANDGLTPQLERLAAEEPGEPRAKDAGGGGE